jgi:hypothetical protein
MFKGREGLSMFRGGKERGYERKEEGKRKRDKGTEIDKVIVRECHLSVWACMYMSNVQDQHW